MSFPRYEMDFSVQSDCGGTNELMFPLLLALICALPVLFWLRKSGHDSRDTLTTAPALPGRHAQRLLDAAVWLLPAAALLLPLLVGLNLLQAFLFGDPVALMRVPTAPESFGATQLDLLPRDGALVLLELGAWLVLRQQLRRSEPDVLNIHARA